MCTPNYDQELDAVWHRDRGGCVISDHAWREQPGDVLLCCCAAPDLT